MVNKKKKKKEQPWQLAISELRNEHKELPRTWLERLAFLIKQASEGIKIDKNEIEALKLGFRFFGGLKEEKVDAMKKLVEKKEERPVSDEEKARWDEIFKERKPKLNE